MASMIVPPGGHRGFAQMTPASRAALFPRGSSGGGRRAKRRKRKAGSSATRSRRKGSRKLKFGSPAWQKKYSVGKFSKKRK